ncbi:MAG TPA: hypothetical protein VEL07_20700 [Planctomycetota bacterium]|nr:hypothetical protein [Planctomycetota bacterium]
MPPPGPLILPSTIASTWPGPLRGEVVYLYAFDFAYDLTRDPLELTTLMGAPIERDSVERSKRHPQRLPTVVQACVRLPPFTVEGPAGPITATATIKVLPVGALTVAVRVPLACASFDDLVAYHDLRLDARVRDLAERAKDELRPICVRPLERLEDEEPYTVFCLAAPDVPGFDALDWLERDRARVAALITQEPDVDLLSRQEIAESTTRALSYYRHDLAVIDWDAALVVDQPALFEQCLWVLEVANVQLTELEAYDRLLDSASERAYADLRGTGRAGRAAIQREIAELRIDLSRVADELANIGSLYGDWHLARTHQAISDRLHLMEWHASIDAKLTTLDELYQFMQQERVNRWMVGLEITIVLLFLVDVALLFLGGK